MAYEVKNYSDLSGIPGFSETLLKNHFKLYEGYVANVNKLAVEIRAAEPGTPAFSEMRRRFGWEFNGMRLHELYFENLSKSAGPLEPGSRLAAQITRDFGSWSAWEKDFKALCSLRGVGWAVLFWDGRGRRLFNTWINEHDAGVLAGGVPVLVGDLFEHAFITDYGLNKADYVAAFLKAVDWAESSRRLEG